jgi:hypothetical protein
MGRPGIMPPNLRGTPAPLNAIYIAWAQFSLKVKSSTSTFLGTMMSFRTLISLVGRQTELGVKQQCIF